MDPRTQERVERWDSRPFAGGYDELSDLADRDFSGAVTAGGAWLFMLNGRVVGVVDGSLENFRDASGTVYVAPDPSLPLLCSMEERGGETRAKYYTNDTPLEEADRTLREGSFTGYIELSENVLSGDYYVVYYGGRRMAAAYIGNAERLLTGDEAFERAADEVGIYRVIDVEIEVTDIPGHEGDTGAAGPGSTGASGASATTDAGTNDATDAGMGGAGATDAAGGAAGGAGGGPGADDLRSGSLIPGDDDGPTADEPAGASASTDDSAEESNDLVTEAEGGDDPDPDSDRRGITVDDGHDAESNGPGITDDPAASGGAGDANAAPADETPDSSAPPAGDRSSLDPDELEAAAEELAQGGVPWEIDGEEADDGAAVADANGAGTGADGEVEDESQLEEPFKREEQWRETRRIPSIDPDRSTDDDADDDRGQRRGQSTASSASTSNRERSSGRSSAGSAGRSAGSGGESGSEADGEARLQRLQRRVEKLEKRRSALEERNEELEGERDRLRKKNRELSSTIEQLRSRIENLDSGDAAATSTRGTELSPQRALSETNLFVRYASKSEPTLAAAHDGEASREEVATNLRIEHHTSFDAADALVAGRPYEEFLADSMEYRFVEWLTHTLPYEIRDTGNADALGDLYDVIPRIDRAELGASISLEDDDTEDVPDEVSFDVVAFDKMGTPLLVATLNDSREPASQEMLEAVEEASSAVSANYPDMGASLVITSSFFQPGALEVAEQATSGGFLSRGSRLSYVNLTRKQGYHLCLMESRTGGFHMTVPEL
ncbi:DUF7527 domain-containing protein [Salinilacihabitans rarus]|uniref:DUF7527 domain-containing protein n=1 Tax=Salinilacihabitans rarus TaxID=2961596 RepID=UPI0020C8780C|nr:transcriptional regulator [Salinilacihabitans rarus]